MDMNKCVNVVWHKNWGIVYHSLLGMPLLVDRDGWELINKSNLDVDNLKISEDNRLLLKRIRESYFGCSEQEIREDINRQADNHIAKLSKMTKISSLSLYITRACNFRCSYCIHFEAVNALKTKPVKTSMSFDVAKKAVDLYIKNLKDNNCSEANIEIIGGEPLLNWEVLKKIIVYTFDEYGKDFKINFGLVSNLTLLTSEIIEVFKEYNISLFSSLDGTQEFNDKARFYCNKEGTYQDILKSMKLAKDLGYPIPGFNFTITDENWGGISEDFIKQAKSWGIECIHGDFNFLGVNKENEQKIIDKLMEILKNTFDNDIQMNGTFSAPFVNLMNGHYFNGLKTFCDKLRGDNFSVDPDGNLFICNYIPINIGNIENIESILTSGEYRAMIKSFMPGQKEICKDCEIEGLCCGGCPCPGSIRNRQDMVFKEMCSIYKMTFQNLLKFVIDVCEKGESYIRKLFYPSPMVENMVEIFEKKDGKDFVIQPIGGVKMNLCSGGLSYETSKGLYKSWLEKQNF